MKKLILSLVAFLTLGLTTANAESVTFDFTTGELGTGNILDQKFTEGPVTIYWEAPWLALWGDGRAEVIKNGDSYLLALQDYTDLYVSAGANIIQSISIDVDSDKTQEPDSFFNTYWYPTGYKETSPNFFEPGEPDTWGNPDCISVSAYLEGDPNVYVKSITVTYASAGDFKFPADAPTFYPDRGVVKNMLIINTTIEDGATIYYTTGDYDATAGVEGMSVYPEGGIAITKPTTITAIVTHPDYENSEPVTSSFIPYDPYTAIFDLNSSTWLQEHNVSASNVPSTLSENDNNVMISLPAFTNFNENFSFTSKNVMSLQNGSDITIAASENFAITSVTFEAHEYYEGTNLFTIGNDEIKGSNTWTPLYPVNKATFLNAAIQNLPNIITSITVTIKEKKPAPTPIISPKSGSTLKENDVITITSEVAGAEIWYTLDGTEPIAYGDETFSYPDSGEGIQISADDFVNNICTVKAIAVADGYDPSEIATATFYHFNDPNAEKTATFEFDSQWFDSWNNKYKEGIYKEGDNLIKVEMADSNDYVYLIVEQGDADKTEIATVKDSKLHVKNGMHITILAGDSDSSIVETASSWITSVEFNCDNGDPKNWKAQHIENGEFADMNGNIWIAPEIQTRALTSDNKVKSVTFKASDKVDSVVIDKVTVKLGGVPTSVDEIEAENDAEAVYYNLQGVRVANPEKGIYIVVKGNKATKQVF